MNFDHDQILMDTIGTHKRPSITLALIGEMTVPIAWAINAVTIHFPVNAMRSLIIQPHHDLDTARNLALENWLKAEPKTEWILLWPPGTYLAWDAIAKGVETVGQSARMGSWKDGAFLLRRSYVETLSQPLFGSNGNWHCGERADLLGDGAAQIEPREPVAPPDGNGSQSYVTAIPTLGKVSMAWIGHLLGLAGPVASNRMMAVTQNREVAEARQRLVDSALGLKPRPAYFFFLGDDMLPPSGGLQMLMETMRKHDAPAVAGLYAMKHRPPEQLLMWRANTPGTLVSGVDFQPGDTVECAGTGLDFVLFKTEVLAKMKEHSRILFKTGMENVPGRGIMLYTEDTFFWNIFKEVTGHGPLVDTRVRVGHFNHFDGGVY